MSAQPPMKSIMRNLILCKLDHQKFAFDLSEVEKVIRAVEITPLPHAQSFFMGVINIHGKIVSVVNLREKLGLPLRPMAITDLFLICTYGKRSIAILINSITGMISCSEDSLFLPQEVLPEQSVYSNLDLVKFILRYENEIILVYDLEKFISNEKEKSESCSKENK
jgi:purine-binding chemotaxis protein CheW